MASTIQLQRTNTLASAFIRYAPLTLSSNDPALSNGDWVRQFILSAPFAWRWNRAATSFTTAIGQSDYSVPLSQFGWIEKAVWYLPTNGNQTGELQVDNNMMVDTLPNQPTRISAQLDDDAGNITFRISPSPDQIYNIAVTFQKSALTFTSMTDTWAPIPDYLSYMYNQGYLAKSFEYMNDPRFVEAMQLFMQMVVSTNGGLTADQKNIFLADRMNTLRQTMNVQQGKA
jgi:hypothetical protein